MKLSNRLLRTPIVCSLRLINESDNSKSFSFKSHPKKCNDDFIVFWDQSFTLSPVSPGGTLLHVRIFEFHMIKDLFICEVYIPLSFLFSEVSKATESIGVDETRTTRDVLTERKVANDIVEDCSRSSPDSIEEPEVKSLGEEIDIMNDHVEIDRNVITNTKVVEREILLEVVERDKEKASMDSNMTPILPSVVVELSIDNDVHSDTSVPLEDSFIPTPEVISDGNCNLSRMDYNNGDSIENSRSDEQTEKSEKVKEIVEGQGIEKHNLFSWLFLTGTLRGQSSNNLETSHNDVALPPAQNENTPITSAFKKIFQATSPPTGKTLETGDNVNTIDPFETAVKPLPMIIGKETVSWYKCYGRGADEQEVEKGEICLGLSLES